MAQKSAKKIWVRFGKRTHFEGCFGSNSTGEPPFEVKKRGEISVIRPLPVKTGIRLAWYHALLVSSDEVRRCSNMGQGILDRVTGRLKVALGAAAVAGLLLSG